MAKQDGKRTSQIIVGEILFNHFLLHPNEPIELQSIADKAAEENVIFHKVTNALGQEFAGQLKTVSRGAFILNPDYQISDFLEALNDIRRSHKLPLLEMPKQGGIEKKRY